MARIEDEVATEIAGKLDEGDGATERSSAEISPMHGASGTVNSLNASSATQPLGGGWDGQHGGTGTEPMPASFNVPADNADDLARIRAEVKASEAETAISLRRHATGYFEPSGHVAGLSEHTDNERTD